MPDDSTPLLIQALRGRPTARRPVWLMRQAGRYLPGYQRVRAEADFLTMCRRPDLSAEVSLEPVRRFGLDGAIVFSDILIPLEAMGCEVRFGDHGPEAPSPVRTAADVAALRDFDPKERTPWILETIARLVAELGPATPVLGFCGAPFTLAAYAVEGRITKSLVHVKALRFRDPALFTELLARFAATTVDYLAAQARAGASALQIFDTWAGELSREDWVEFALPATRDIVSGVKAALGAACPPIVLYTKGTGAWLEALPETGADAYSVDWRIPLAEAQDRLGGRPVQGNLDPTVLHAGPDDVRAATRRMLDGVAGRHGIVANLGHGVLVGTPPDNVAAMVNEVKGS